MPPYPLRIAKAADASFVAHVQRLIADNAQAFAPNKFDPDTREWFAFGSNFDPIVNAKKLELAGSLKLADWYEDPKHRDFIGCISEGGSVHPHRDTSDAGRRLLRINLLICKPERGGVPVLDGQPVDVDEGDAWLCFASECRHASTPVEGAKIRSVLSYGLQTDQREVFPVFAKYFHWRATLPGADAAI